MSTLPGCKAGAIAKRRYRRRTPYDIRGAIMQDAEHRAAAVERSVRFVVLRRILNCVPAHQCGDGHTCRGVDPDSEVVERTGAGLAVG